MGTAAAAPECAECGWSVSLYACTIFTTNSLKPPAGIPLQVGLRAQKSNQRNDNCAAVSRRYIAVVGTWRRKSLLRLSQAAWRVRRSIRKRPDLIWLLRPDLALSFSACTNSFAKRNNLSALPDGPTSKLWLPLEGPRRFRRRVQRRDQRVHDEN